MRYSSEFRSRIAESLPSLKIGSLKADGTNGGAAGFSENIVVMGIQGSVLERLVRSYLDGIEARVAKGTSRSGVKIVN